MLQKPKYVEILYQLNLDIGHVREKLVEYISRIKHWPSQYLQQQKRENTTESNNIHRDYDITKIVDIEENIWSPYYGFKGTIMFFVLLSGRLCICWKDFKRYWKDTYLCNSVWLRLECKDVASQVEKILGWESRHWIGFCFSLTSTHLCLFHWHWLHLCINVLVYTTYFLPR